MKLLLDSHVLLWWASGDDRLGPGATGQIDDPDNEVLLSAVTVWELGIKAAAGRLDLPRDLVTRAMAEGLQPLPIGLDHAAEAASLPRLHGDPFDRMLVAQSRVEGLTILTSDRVIPSYDVRVLAADR